MNKEQKILLGILTFIGLSISAIYVAFEKDKQNTIVDAVNYNTQLSSATTSLQSPIISTQASDPEMNSVSISKTVSTTIHFNVPKEHTDTLTVTATVKDGIITSINYSQNSSNRESEQYYSRFVRSFSSSEVVGKKIDDVSLSRVGGASLTTSAFNKALSSLSQQI